ncbi:hypothetical protein E5D57_000191 [Metarhizium anisopliae]|nr:hypothetical protein E5D57_010986 [Metarhizium anisopliae]KAF5136429.1 hypothetical protein E5D57_000191 [Metarhizium anisopliae]
MLEVKINSDQCFRAERRHSGYTDGAIFQLLQLVGQKQGTAVARMDSHWRDVPLSALRKYSPGFLRHLEPNEC